MVGAKTTVEAANAYWPLDFPIPVYVVSKDGSFLGWSKKLEEVLEVGADGLRGRNISEFYREPDNRHALLERLDVYERSGQWLEKAAVGLRTQSGRVIEVQDYCRSVRRNGETIGYIGCLVDVTQEERFFDDLPIGVYVLDERDRIVQANKSMAAMLGYESGAELVDMDIAQLYAHPEEAASFKKRILSERYVVNAPVELLKRTGETIFASANSFVVTSKDGGYLGREGVLIDVTQAVIYARMMDDVPVGFYVVHVEDGKDIIRQYNKQFANMFEFEQQEEVFGLDISELYDTREDYDRFKAEIAEKDKRKEPLLGRPLRVRTRKGNHLVIEVNSRLLHDPGGNITGRVGVVRNITAENALREEQAELDERIRDLTTDIGRVLHNYSSKLVMLKQVIYSVAQSLHPGYLDEAGARTPADAVDSIRQPARLLAQHARDLMTEADLDRTLSEDSLAGVLRLSELTALLDDQESISQIEFRMPAVREVAEEVHLIARKLSEVASIRRPAVELQRGSTALLRLCSLISLRRARDSVCDMEQPVNALRDYVTRSFRQEAKKKPRKIRDLIGRVGVELEEFAKSQGVGLRFRVDHPDALVVVVERDAIRALSSLLHNAIKYSWKRDEGQALWVSIRTGIDGGRVYFLFENWGVPIPREEIERGIIFEVGQRGRLSGDRWRSGTGIGLTDALAVARDHEGDVTISSRPAGGKSSEHYQQPFITTATFWLPVHVEEPKEES